MNDNDIMQLRRENTELSQRNHALTQQIEPMRAELAATKAERDTARTILATEQGKVTTLTQERDTLRADFAAERVQLKADFDTRVNDGIVSGLANHGVRLKAVNVGGAGGAGAAKAKGLTATEKVLMAKGVSSLQELYERNAENASAST